MTECVLHKEIQRLAISSSGLIYIADGTNIRVVDPDGIIFTLIGDHSHKSHWKPMPCSGTDEVSQVTLRWPTELAVNPLDDSLYFIDDHLVLRITKDKQVQTVGGQPLHCPRNSDSPGSRKKGSQKASHAILTQPQSMAFSPSGDLYVAESDGQRVNRVRVIKSDGTISSFAGEIGPNSKPVSSSGSSTVSIPALHAESGNDYLALTTVFGTVTAIAVTPDGVLHIADQGNAKIRSVTSSLPPATATNEYVLFAPEVHEAYVFNRFGQHIRTKNLVTGKTKYTFGYNVNTSTGKLSTVTDSAGNTIKVLRGYGSRVSAIENAQSQKFMVSTSRIGLLESFVWPDSTNVTFSYVGPSGLLAEKVDAVGDAYKYGYDRDGRLTSLVTATGHTYRLEFDLGSEGAVVSMARDGRPAKQYVVHGSVVTVLEGDGSEMRDTFSKNPDGSVVSKTAFENEFMTEVVPSNVLSNKDPLLANNFPVPAVQRVIVGGELVNSFEWRYFSRLGGRPTAANDGSDIAVVGRQMRVNGLDLLSFEYDLSEREIRVQDRKEKILTVKYDEHGRPVLWTPPATMKPVEMSYDAFSNIQSWTRGSGHVVDFKHDMIGRLIEISSGNNASTRFEFGANDLTGIQPMKLTMPGGSIFEYEWDESGGLSAVKTPLGSRHLFAIRPSFGFYRITYQPPIGSTPFSATFDGKARVLQASGTGHGSRVQYYYDPSSDNLKQVLFGDAEIELSYYPDTGLLKTVTHLEKAQKFLTDYKYQSGLVKEESADFRANDDLESYSFQYQYDGHGRLIRSQLNVGGKDTAPLLLKMDAHTGILDTVAGLKFDYRDKMNTYVTDGNGVRGFRATYSNGPYGDLKSVAFVINDKQVFEMKLNYDAGNRIAESRVTVGRSTRQEQLGYDADGHLRFVKGRRSFEYSYDANGNCVRIAEEGETWMLSYDKADRLTDFGEHVWNRYDSDGRVRQTRDIRFTYNSKSQLMHAVQPDGFRRWYIYDHRDRLAAWL
ncbi:unnamed protein product, partial [Notodromas monacha]